MHIGIDLGGTKIEILALDSAGTALFRKRIATPQGSYQDTLSAIVRLVSDAEQATKLHGTVGIATPGAVSRLTGKIKNANSTCLNDQPLVEDLQRLLNREIRIQNDANCFALSEATDGAAAGAAVVFGIILGTGVGGGMVVNGQLLTGANAIAGEWGHNPLPYPRDDERPGRTCYCGKLGCIETWLSGPGLANHFLENTGRPLSAEQIVANHVVDRDCESALSAYEDRLARSLANIINVIDPDVIVLGGGLSNVMRLYENVPRRWGQYVFSDQVVTKLLPPKYGDASGARGAAWLFT